jgi:hypothetical protein
MIKSRKMIWICRKNEEENTAYRLFLVNAEGKRSIGRSSYRWVHNIQRNLAETGCRGTDWIDVAQDKDLV